MRFRSGTLERSVKRWSRFPKFSKFQRKQHGFFYTLADETALSRTGTTTDLIIVDNTDWNTGSSAHSSVRNVAFDIRLMMTWTPQATATAYDSWWWGAGIFIKDTDDTGGTMIDSFASQRALWWNAAGRNSAEMAATLTPDATPRHINWVARGRARFMKFDDELRLQVSFNGDVTSTINDARLSVFGRISWEIP